MLPFFHQMRDQTAALFAVRTNSLAYKPCPSRIEPKARMSNLENETLRVAHLPILFFHSAPQSSSPTRGSPAPLRRHLLVDFSPYERIRLSAGELLSNAFL